MIACLINKSLKSSNMTVTICLAICSIVSEAGASIYSASEEANKEMPHLDVSVRGAGAFDSVFYSTLTSS